MYAATAGPYCYPGTTVLKNRAGLREREALDVFEAAMVTQRLDEPLPAGRLSYSHYRAIHRHIFGDVYAWAGRIRTVRIARTRSIQALVEYAQIAAMMQHRENDDLVFHRLEINGVREVAHRRAAKTPLCVRK